MAIRYVPADLTTIIQQIRERQNAGANWKQLRRMKQEKAFIERNLASQGYDVRQQQLARAAEMPKSKKSAFTRQLNLRGDAGEQMGALGLEGVGEQLQDTKQITDQFAEQGVLTEQGRGTVKGNMEHAMSVSGDPKQYLEQPTPLTYSYKDTDGPTKNIYKQIPQRGANVGKTTFPGSQRWNVKIGENNSFTMQQMEDIGRPKNWLEAIVDEDAFQDRTMIDINNNDWLMLQQKRITVDELVAHKLRVHDLAQSDFIFMEAVTPEEAIRVIDHKEGKKSLVKHEWGLDEQGNRIPGGLSGEKRDFKQRTWELGPNRITEDTPVQRLKPGEGIRVGANRAIGKLSKADAMAQMGMHVVSGNYPGAIISAGALSVNLVGESPVVQKRFAELAAKLVAERQAKTAAKLIPGLDVGLSAVEAWSYISEGKFDQAGIAALAGAIGWAGPVGDFGAALLDASNTAIDIARLRGSMRQEIVDTPDSTDRRSIAELTEQGEDLGAWASEVDANKKMRRVRNRGLNIDNAALRGLSRAL